MKKWILIIAAVAIWQNWGAISNAISPSVAPELSGKANGEVVMYSTDWCGYCKKLKGFLRESDIPFTELNIERNAVARSEYEKLGGGGIPLSLVNGKVVRGYNTRAIVDALK